MAGTRIAKEVLRHPRFNARRCLCHKPERVLARDEREAGDESFQGKDIVDADRRMRENPRSTVLCKLGRVHARRATVD